MNQLTNFTKGFFRENPVYILLLGLCPALGTTTSAFNGLGMGLATTFVLVMANIVISLAKKQIPAKVRIPSFIVVIASFVTMVDLIMAGFMPGLHEQLGLFIPLIVVNCLVLGRAEAFASKNNLISSLIDGLGMGLGFALALTALGAVREIFGSMSIFNWKIAEGFAKILNPETDFSQGDGMLVFILAPGAFLAMGYLTAIWFKIAKK